MTLKGSHIAAGATFGAAVLLGAIGFSAIGKTVENQRQSAAADARIEQISALATSTDEGIARWTTPKTEALQTVFAGTGESLTAATHTIDEVQCLAEAVYYEARSETLSGQRAVAEVVLNRVKSKHFPNNICGVVYEGSARKTGCQFSFTCDGSMDIKPRGKAWDRSFDVAEYVMSGGHTPMTSYATHYHTTQVSPKWSGTMRMSRRVGSHVFYRFAPRDYRPSEPMVLVAPPI